MEVSTMPIAPEAPRHRDWISLVPILAGVFWLTADAASVGWLLFALIPGCLLLGSGVGLLLWPGDVKITHYMALGGVLGVLLGILAIFAGGIFLALIAIAASIAAFLIAGRVALQQAPLIAGVPSPPMTWKVYAKAALDEALIGYFVFLAKIPSGDQAAQMSLHAKRLGEVLERSGWLDDPATFHRAPTAPIDARLEPARWGKLDFQRMSYASSFVPHPELPGAEVWSGHQRNRQCSVRVLRHAQVGRPWLLCIHGYRMGMDFMDFRLFPPTLLHHKLGLNLAMPVLPLHGPRRLGRQSGDYFLDGDLLDLLHAEAQALWDLRTTVAWIRAQEPGARIGVLGYSLGGYNASLLATYETGLDFVIAGIPVADFASTLWQHVPPQHRAYFAASGLDLPRYERLMRVVSPLARPPQLSADRLHLFAGTADRVVVPAQPTMLSQHWKRPVTWFPGGHLTFRGEPSVRHCIEAAFASAGWNPGGAGDVSNAPAVN